MAAGTRTWRPGGRRGGWFRGWSIVAAGFVVLFVVYALQFSYGEFRLAATEEEGWSQTTLSLIFAGYIAVYSALSVVSGWATDRFGPRRTVATGSILLCSGYALWAVSDDLAVVAIALAVVAAIGMSCSWVPVNATAVRWFVRRRGRATAITTTGGSVGNIVGPPVAATLIAALGWRAALATMAGVGLCLLLGAAAVLTRDPEAVGLHPDGDPHPPPAGRDDAALTPAEAIRTRTYWVLWAMYSLTFVVVFVPFVHGSAFAVGLGTTRLAAATVISSIGIGGLSGRLIVGSVSDRIDRRRAAAGALVLQAIGFCGLAAADGLGVLYPSAITFGFGYGGAVAVFPALVGDYFGRANAGAIVGWMFASAASMAAIGPYVAALIFDATDSYRLAFLASAALNGVSFLLATRLPRRGPAASRGDPRDQILRTRGQRLTARASWLLHPSAPQFGAALPGGSPPMVAFDSFEPGTPNWVDLMSPDVDASKAFYSAVFGWEAEDQFDDEGNRIYVQFRKDGRNVAGLGGQPPGMENMPPVWNTYIATADAEATAAKVAEAGGQVMMPPMQVMTAGSMAIFTDPSGAAFSVWQADEHHGYEVGNEPNTFSWNELMSRDVDAAKAFYAEVFGWQYDTQDMGPAGKYHVIAGGENGGLGGLMAMPAEVPEMVPSHWMPYVMVADVDATVAAVTGNGGQVVVEPFEVPGVGRVATVHDTAGGAFSLMQPEG